MRGSFTKAETGLLLFCVVLLAAALFAPALAQPAHAHDFADQRTLWSVPCALDVLSNLPFAIAGVFGLFALRRVEAGALSAVQSGCSALFFVGLIVTACASGFYHWRPDDVGLAVDRAGMSVAFAGLLGLLVATHVSDLGGRAMAIAVMLLAPAAVAAWFFTGNVLPWALVQFGGIPLLLLFAFAAPRGAGLHVRWAWIVAAYAVAKAFEMNDATIFAATGELLSGHTLKHLAAAFAAVPVIAGVAALSGGQNPPKQEAAAASRMRSA